MLTSNTSRLTPANVKHGFTLVELLIVVFIGVMLSVVFVRGFGELRKKQVLDEVAGNVASLIMEAKTNTVLSKNDSQYGVHFATSSATLFAGAVYDEGGAGNVPVSFLPFVELSGTALQGGGSDIVFERLTGKTNTYGTVTLSLIGSTTTARTIHIEETGLVEIQ